MKTKDKSNSNGTSIFSTKSRKTPTKMLALSQFNSPSPINKRKKFNKFTFEEVVSGIDLEDVTERDNVSIAALSPKRLRKGSSTKLMSRQGTLSRFSGRQDGKSLDLRKKLM